MSSAGEGRCCACDRTDFLPLHCRKCERDFCSEHFTVHNASCAASARACEVGGGGGVGGRVSDMFHAAEHRFDNHASMKIGMTKEHHQVKATPKANGGSVDRGEREERLQKLQKNSDSSTVASKTREILLKNKAKGDEEVALEDRFYFTVVFDHQQESSSGMPPPTLCLFFNKHLELGEVLHRIATSMPEVAFQTAVRPADLSLTVSYGGTVFDRRAQISSLFQPFCELHLTRARTQDVVAAQQAVESQKSAAAAAAAASRVAIDPQSIKVGDRLLYSKAGVESPCQILLVHRDDFPNLYFTIRFPDAREKQTTADYLSSLPVGGSSGGGGGKSGGGSSERTVDAGAGAAGFSITVTHSGNKFAVTGLTSNMTVLSLKLCIAKLTGIAPTNQKLVNKGSVLKDNTTLSGAKTPIIAGSKLTFFGQ